MSRRCSVCQHPDIAEINLALATCRLSIRDIAGRYGLSRTAVHTHGKQHLISAMASATANVPDTSNDAATVVAVEHVQEKRRAEIAANASIRAHVVRDIELLETMIANAVASGAGGHVIALLRQKYAIFNRTGMVADLDVKLDARRVGESPVVLAVEKQEHLTRLLRDFARRTGIGLQARDDVADQIEDFETGPVASPAS